MLVESGNISRSFATANRRPDWVVVVVHGSGMSLEQVWRQKWPDTPGNGEWSSRSEKRG